MPTVLLLKESAIDSAEIEELSFDVEASKSIYDALELCGYKINVGCLAGSCAVCRLEIVEGHQNLSPPGHIEQDTLNAISSDHPGKTIRLGCRAKILGNIKIKKPSF